MMKGRLNILILGAGTQGLAIVKRLVHGGGRIIMLVNERGNYADSSKYVSRCYMCSLLPCENKYLDKVEEIISAENIDVLIPMGDGEAEFLSKNKEHLHKIVHFAIPEYESFLKGYDKNKLMTLCAQKDYPHPRTIDLSKVDVNDCNELRLFPYPAIMKPNCTTGGRGMKVVDSYKDFLAAYPALHKQFGDYHLQRFIRAGGRQVKVQLSIDKDGNLLNQSVLRKVRWYPVKGGSSSCSVTIKNNDVVNKCYQILKNIKWEGFADFDLIEDPDTNELLIMEINPRLPACIGAAVHAGVNWGQIMVDQALGKKQGKYSYKEGVTLRHLGFDLLWFLKSGDRLKSKPSWFKFFGKNVYYQDFDLTDQMPFWVGTFHNIKKLLNPSFREAKSI